MADEDYIGTLGEKSTRWQRILFYANEITDDVYELIAYKFSPVEAPKTGSFWGEGWDFHVDPSLLDWQIAYGLVHHIDHYVRLHAARLEDRVNEIWCDATCIECHMAWAPIMTSERIMSRLQKEAEKRFGAAFNSTSNRDKILEELWMPPGMNFAKFFGIKEPDDAEHIYDLIKDKYQVQNNQVTALNGPQGGGGGKDKQQGGGGQGQGPGAVQVAHCPEADRARKARTSNREAVVARVRKARTSNREAVVARARKARTSRKAEADREIRIKKEKVKNKAVVVSRFGSQ